jgi:class 3 adenylate cyclase
MKYCGMCSTRLERMCPACGYANPQNFRFCGMCGKELFLGAEEENGTSPAVSGIRLPPESASSVSIPLTGERRVVTVILTDISGSTQMLERVGTDRWVSLMNDVLQLQESEVYRFGGTVDQFRGDGMVAFFGAEHAQEDDPERAILAALAMNRAVKDFSKSLQDDSVELQLRVGIETGEVIVGRVGNRHQHVEDTAMGIGVAVAARMESSAEPGTVLVSEHTYQLAESDFEWLALGEIQVKGLSKPVTVYRPLEPRQQMEQVLVHDTQMQEGELFGKQQFKENILQRIQGLFAGKGSIIFLTAEAGMGKQFLLRAVRRELGQLGYITENGYNHANHEQGLWWIQVRCRSYYRNEPYAIWREAVLSWLQVKPEEEAIEIRQRLWSQVNHLWGDSAVEFYPYLTDLLSLPVEEPYQERLKYLDAGARHQQIVRAIRHWVEELAIHEPLVLVFSDMHWADASSLDLLEQVLSYMEQHSILFLLLFRPDRTANIWDFRLKVEKNYPHRMINLEIQPFSPEESAEFVDVLAGSADIPDMLKAEIIRHSEGNPYFIREIIRSMKELLDAPGTAGRHFDRQAVLSIDLPKSLHRLLQARIDGLTKEQKATLQYAAVIGPVFWFNVLVDLAGEESPVAEHLLALQRAGMIVQRGKLKELGMEYAFSSNLLRDAAYEGILVQGRARLHLKVAEYLETFACTNCLNRYDGLIALHYRLGGNLRKELFFTLQAAEEAQRVYANKEVLNLCNRAIEVVDELQKQAVSEHQKHAIYTQQFEVIQMRHRVYEELGMVEESYRDTDRLLELARKMPEEPSWMVDALLEQPGVHGFGERENLDKGIELAGRAYNLAEQIGDEVRRLGSLGALANLKHARGLPDSLEIAERALALAGQLGEKRTEALLLIGMGQAFSLDDPQRSLVFLEQARAISHDLGDKRLEVEMLGLMGGQYERQGDYYRLLTEYEIPRLIICQEIGLYLAEGFVEMYCGQIEGLYLGNYPAARKRIERALSMTESVTGRLFPLLRLAQLAVAMSDFDTANKTLAEAQPISMKVESILGTAGLALVNSIYFNSVGGQESYEKVLNEIQTVFEMGDAGKISRQYEMAARCEAAAAYLGLATQAGDEQRHDFEQKALENSTMAVHLFDTYGFTQIIECSAQEIFYRHSLCLGVNGDPSGAEKFLRKSFAEMMRKHGMIPADSPYSISYLQNIRLHEEIKTAHSILEMQKKKQRNHKEIVS